MNTTYAPLTERQRRELQGRIALGPMTVRSVLYLLVVALITASLRSIHDTFIPNGSFFSSALWWIVPSAAFAFWFYRLGRRLTGGRAARNLVQKDLARGEAAVHHIEVADAVEAEEMEDEGPAYFILTGDRKVLFFSGQYLEPFKRKKFPWKTFDILEAPESKVFFGIHRTGDPFLPSFIRQPLTWEELKRFNAFKGRYRVLEIDFESLKINPVKPKCA